MVTTAQGWKPRRGVFTTLAMRLVFAGLVVAVIAGGVQYILESGECVQRAKVRVSDREGDWVFQIDAEGEPLVVQGEGAPAGLFDRARVASHMQSQNPVGARARVWDGGSGPPVALYAWRDDDGGRFVAGARVVGLEAAGQRALVTGVIVFGGVSTFSVWLTLRARRSFRRSLRRISAVVSRVGKSGRMRDVRTGAPELRRLARVLNKSLSSLTQRVEVLGARRAEAKAILRSMPGAVLALDLEQRVMNANRVAERVLEIDADEAQGRLLHEIVRQPALLRFVADSVGAGDLRTDEFALRGVVDRVVAASSRPLLDIEKEITGVVVVLQDVTRLRKLENMRRDFASNASHELRTPVTNILGYIETLAECDDMAADERSRFIGVIRRNTERLAAIIEDMLELARLESPESAGLTLDEPVHAAKLCDDLAAGVAPELERAGTSLEVECEPSLRVEVNRGLMEQAVGNLLANAVRYSPAGTVVRLSVEARHTEEGECVEFAVHDEGPGIPEEHLPRLFERFYRVDPARSREMGGTGLGLAIAKHVAMLHGGEIGVTSELGKGSRFWIRIPHK